MISFIDPTPTKNWHCLRPREVPGSLIFLLTGSCWCSTTPNLASPCIPCPAEPSVSAFSLDIIYFLKAGKVVKAVPANTENSDIVIPLLTKTSDDVDWTNDNFDTVIDHMLVKNSFSVHMFGHTVKSS
jgi:hypothetical protein